MQYVRKSLAEMEKKAKSKTKVEDGGPDTLKCSITCNFLKNVKNSADGMNKLIECCKRLPNGM